MESPPNGNMPAARSAKAASSNAGMRGNTPRRPETPTACNHPPFQMNMMAQCFDRPASQSSAARTWARAHCSTGSSASASPSSRIRRASPRSPLRPVRVARTHVQLSRHGRYRSGSRQRRRPYRRLHETASGGSRARGRRDRVRRRRCVGTATRSTKKLRAILRRTRKPVLLVANKAESPPRLAVDLRRVLGARFRRADCGVGDSRRRHR